MSTTESSELDLQTVFRALVEGRQPIGPVALIVAHPGDDVVGVGGQLERWRRGLVCVHVTDGAQARPAEARDALERVGISADQIRSLDFTDQQLVFALSDLDRALEHALAEIRPAVVITHAFEGGHPDHDALALVLASVLGRRRARHVHTPVLVEFAGYWQNESGSLVTNRFGPPSNGGERQLRMSTPIRRQKNDLLGCFRMPQHLPQAFDTREEWIRPAPAYDFRARPNVGRVWYDQFDWPVRSDHWIHLATTYLDGESRQEPIGVVC